MPPLASVRVRLEPDATGFSHAADRQIGRSRLGLLGRKHGKVFGTGFSAAAGAAFGAGTYAAVSILGKVIKSARELGLAQLQATAKNAGVEWGKFSGRLAGAQSRMEKLGFSNAEVNASLTRLLTTTRDSGLSLRALSTAADLARFKHVSLAEASVLLSRAAAGNTRALKDVGITTAQLPKNFATTMSSADRLRVVMELMGKRIGGQASAYTETFGGKLAVLRARLTDVAAKIGVALLPVLSKFADLASKYLVPALAAFGRWMNSTAVPAIQRFAKAAEPVVKYVAGAFVAGFKAIVGVIKGLPGPAKIAAAAIVGIGVALKFAAANPWTAIALAIVVAVGLIVKNWDKIKRAAVVVWNAVKNAVSSAWHSVEDTLHLSAIWKWMQTAWRLTVAEVRAAWGVIGPLVKAGWKVVSGVFRTGAAVITGLWRTAWNVILGAARTIWALIKGFFKTAWAVFSGTFRVILNLLTFHWDKAWHEIFVAGKRIWNSIRDTLKDVWNSVSGTAVRVWNAISTMFVRVWNGIKRTVGGAVDWIKATLKTTWRVVHDVAKAAWKGVATAISVAWRAVANFVRGPVEWVRAHVLVPLVKGFTWLVGKLSFGKLKIGLGPLGNPIPRFAEGGRLAGYGGGDRRLIMAEDGETVVSKETSRKPDMVAAFRRNRVPGYAEGGRVGNKGMSGKRHPDDNGGFQPPTGIGLATWLARVTMDLFTGQVGDLVRQFTGLIKYYGRAGGAGGFMKTVLIDAPAKIVGAMMDALMRSIPAGAPAIVRFAKRQLGKPYVWGAEGPGAFDCSGLVKYVYNHFGIFPPRTSQAQYGWVRRTLQPKPGGLAFYTGSGGSRAAPGHVGIVANSDWMVNAYGTGYGVRMDRIFGAAGRPVGFGLPPHGWGTAGGGPGGNRQSPAAAKQYAKSLFPGHRWVAATQWPALRDLWTRESGWRWNATNPLSGAYGIPQSLPASKMAAAGRDWRTNAYTQVRWGEDYIGATYGDPVSANRFWWAHYPPGRYRRGGRVRALFRGGRIAEPVIGVGRSGTAYTLAETEPEVVTPESSMAAVERLLRQLITAVDRNADATAAGLAAVLNGTTRAAGQAARYGVRG